MLSEVMSAGHALWAHLPDLPAAPSPNPLQPDENVRLNSGLESSLRKALGVLRILAYTALAVALVFCSIILAWSWKQGKPIQALTNVFWIFVASLLLGLGLSVFDFRN